jgi:putative SOS response-associated peptidase YedK
VRITGANYRQPYYVRLANRPVFGLAAVWDRSVADDDDVIESCSVIRVPANDLLADIVRSDHRMPAILRRQDYDTWLRGTPVQAKAALQSYNPAWMQAYAVSPRINSTEPDDPGLIRPVH